DDAALLKRVQDAFVNLRTADGKLKSLRFDATMPFLGGAYRVRMAYAAPDRYYGMILTEDGKCPIGIATRKGAMVYDAARGRMLTNADGAAMYFVVTNEFGTNLQFQLGIDLKKDPTKGLQLDLGSLLRLTPLNKTVRRTKAGLIYEARSKRGNRLIAHLREAPRLAVTRVELWIKEAKLPFFLIDEIEVNAPAPEAVIPSVRAEDWAEAAPQDALWPKEWDALPDQQQTLRWAQRWYALMLGPGALDRGLNRKAVLPRADAKEWDKAVAQHRALTPRILARWKELYGATMPPVDTYRVSDKLVTEVGDWFPVAPTNEEERLAQALIAQIRDRHSGAGGLDRVVVDATEWLAGEPAYRVRVTVNGDRFGMQAVSTDSSTPLAVASEDICALFDAAAGRLLTLPRARTAMRFGKMASGIGTDVGLNVEAADPRLSLNFLNALEADPKLRRGLPHPTAKGLSILEARDESNGRVRFVCDAKKVPVVREVRLLTNDLKTEIVLLRLREWTNADIRPAISPDIFKAVLPAAPLDGADEQWRVAAADTVTPINPLYFVALERLALRRPELRAVFPDRSKQHWTAFEQRENELTPQVTKIWRKAFGTLR
ncbi:MAG: hypothetical protein ACYS0F_12800, partial [Planctomycetota bacterium]